MGAMTASAPRVGGGPTMDGRLITMRSFNESAPEISSNVPMLIGSVSEEGNRMSSHPTEADWHKTLAGVIGDAKAAALIAAMKNAHPEKSIRTLSYGVSGLLVRNRVTQMAGMKFNQKAAPVFTYFFTWQSPMLEDAGAWHTSELAFCFDNTKRCEQGTGNTPEAQKLARTMATAWADFARTGNPSQSGLTWTPFESDRCPTMKRQQMPHGKRPRRRCAQNPLELTNRCSIPRSRRNQRSNYRFSQSRTSPGTMRPLLMPLWHFIAVKLPRHFRRALSQFGF